MVGVRQPAFEDLQRGRFLPVRARTSASTPIAAVRLPVGRAALSQGRVSGALGPDLVVPGDLRGSPGTGHQLSGLR